MASGDSLFSLNLDLANPVYPSDSIINTILTQEDNGSVTYGSGLQLPPNFNMPAVYVPPIPSNQVGTTDSDSISDGSSILDALSMAGKRLIGGLADYSVAKLNTSANQQVAPGQTATATPNMRQNQSTISMPMILLIAIGAYLILERK